MLTAPRYKAARRIDAPDWLRQRTCESRDEFTTTNLQNIERRPQEEGQKILNADGYRLIVAAVDFEGVDGTVSEFPHV